MLKKTLLMILFFLYIIHFANGQEEQNALPYVSEPKKFDTAAQFKGGDIALQKFFSDSIRFPQAELIKGKQGYVSTKFIVTASGAIRDVIILNGVPGAPGFATEAKRLLLSMPYWIPATKDGKAVDSEYRLFVPFKIE